MSRHDVWPTCTVPTCLHGRTYPDGHALYESIREHRHDWITEAGQAICVCHDYAPEGGPRERFVCDHALAANPHKASR